MKAIIAVLLVCAPLACFSQTPSPPQGLHIVDGTAPIIPATRMVSWSPGIPGGIPSPYPVGANVRNSPYNAVGDGVADDTSAFNAAITACATGHAVYIPAGRYKLTSQINITKTIVLRGAGPTQTYLISTKNAGSSPDAAIVFQGSGSSTNSFSQTAYRNSSNVVLSSTAGLAVGNWVSVKQSNDPSLITGTLEHPTATLQSQIAQITAINGSTVTLSRPLYWDYNLSKSPFLSKHGGMLTGAGIENLSLDSTGTTMRGVLFIIAARCWAHNVTVTIDHSVNHPNGSVAGINLDLAAQCNVQRSTILRPTSHSLQASKYGIQIDDLSSDNLIEDNIIDGFSAGILLQGGSSGNVVAYNYVHRGFGDTTTTNDLRFGIISHGDFANSNLFEGNNVPCMASDNYWGCNRANTFLRNWARRQSLNEINAEVTGTLIAVRVDAQQYYLNFVGNILDSPRDIGTTDAGSAANPSSRMTWQTGSDQDNTYPPLPYPVDPLVASTTLRHGNFDFVSNGVSWDSTISNHTIPNSYYLSSKPSWFGSMAWPPIGPDVNTSGTITDAPVIPAQARWLGVSY